MIQDGNCFINFYGLNILINEKMENYFIILNSEGDTFVEEVSKPELLRRINENYYGSDTGHLSDIKERNTNYWGENLLIIKGNIVTPTSVKVVTEYDID